MVSYSLEDIKFEFKHKRLNNAWLKMVAKNDYGKYLLRLADEDEKNLVILKKSERTTL